MDSASSIVFKEYKCEITMILFLLDIHYILLNTEDKISYKSIINNINFSLFMLADSSRSPSSSGASSFYPHEMTILSYELSKISLEASQSFSQAFIAISQW